MSSRMMTFIISIIVLLAGIAFVAFIPRIDVAVGVGLITTVVGYWIREAQDRVSNGKNTVTPASTQ